MREIKFRVWDYQNDEMIYEVGITPKSDLAIPYSIDAPNDGFDQFNYYIESKLMQYTGLNDKNGQEIYEGDVYQYNVQAYVAGYAFESNHTAEVTYDDGAFWVGDYLLIDAIENDDESEIIGNKFEHPELLEDNT